MTTMTDSEALAVLDDAIRVVALCDPWAQVRQHPAANSLEAQAFNVREPLRQARAHIAKALRDAARYRHLKAYHISTVDEYGTAEQLYFPTHGAGELDAAIDAAMKGDHA